MSRLKLLTHATPFGCVSVTSYLRIKLMKGNLPLSKPGFYGLLNLTNAKWYIGATNNMSDRARDHARVNHAWAHNLPKLRAAMEVDGPENFLFIPLFYLTDQTRLERFAEADLIDAFDACNNGYNTYPKPSDALRTETTNAARAITLQSDRIRALRRQQMAKPEQVAAMQAGLTPEVIDRRTSSIKAAYQTPSTKATWTKAMEKVRSNEEVNNKRKASVKASWERRRQQFGPNGRRAS